MEGCTVTDTVVIIEVAYPAVTVLVHWTAGTSIA